MFKSKEEAKMAFKRLIAKISRDAALPADSTAPFNTDAQWLLEDGLDPLKLLVRRGSFNVTQFIELLCGYESVVIGSERGVWRYYCRQAMGWDFETRLYGDDYTVFETMEELEEALLHDINMYQDGSYLESNVRPRSRFKSFIESGNQG